MKDNYSVVFNIKTTEILRLLKVFHRPWNVGHLHQLDRYTSMIGKVQAPGSVWVVFRLIPSLCCTSNSLCNCCDTIYKQ